MSSPFVLFAQLQYPETKKGETVENYHGTKVADPYRWLEDDNSQETKDWVKAQNKVTFDYLATIPQRDRIKSDWKNYGITPGIPRLLKG